MIFKIADGREYFYQWDIDRQIIVSDPTIKEVHFCNRTDDYSLVVEVVDGVADVPNIILQKSFDVRVFGYDGKATLHEATFKVKARTQPADYVYTETVVKSIEEILEAAETVTTTANEFYEFVEDHTLGFTDDGEGNVELVAVDAEESVDLTDYYTKTEVNELIENIDIPETDLTGYATEEYVDNAIAAIEIPEGGGDADLSNYYTKEETYSKTEVDGLIPEPTDLTNYYTKTEVDEAIANIDIPEESSGGTSVTVGGEAQETWDADTKLDKLTSTGGNAVVAYTMRANGTQDKMVINTSSSGYLEYSNSIVAYRNSQIPLPNAPTQDYHAANKKYVDDAIANIEIPEADVDLSNYYTKEETYSKTEVDSLISEPEKSYILKFQEGNSKAITDEATIEFLNLVHDTGKVPLAHLSLEIVGQSRVLTITDVEWDRTYDQIVFSTYSYLAANQNDLLIDTVKVNRSTAGTWTSSWIDRRLTYTTKSYVTTAIQNALNAIGVAEGGAY